MDTSVPLPALGSISATVESACRFRWEPPTDRGVSASAPAAGSISLMSTSGPRLRDGGGGSAGDDGPAEPDDPPVIVVSSAAGGCVSILRFFSSASANMASDRRYVACTSLASASFTRRRPSSVSAIIFSIRNLHMAVWGRPRTSSRTTSVHPPHPGVRPCALTSAFRTNMGRTRTSSGMCGSAAGGGPARSPP